MTAVNERGLKGNRDAQGNLTTIDMTDPNTVLKQEAFQMEDADLESLAAQLTAEIEKGEESQAVMLQERLDIVNSVIASRQEPEDLNIDVEF